MKLYHTAGSSERIVQNQRERSAIKYHITDYGVMMDLQKKTFIEPAESWPHRLKITLWKEQGCLV